MKILHVVNVSFVIPYFFGEQINFFQKKGFDVYLVCSDSVDLNPLSSKYGFKYKAINIDRKFGLFSSIISFFQLYFFIRNNRFDIVVGHTPKASFLAMLASYFNFVPRRIYLRHGILYETSSGFKRGILIFFEKFTSLLSTKVLCVSQSVLNISLNDNLNSSHKTCLISKGSCNGVDSVNFFNPDLVTKETLNIYKAKHNIDDNDFVIGFVGRIVNDKGIKEILLAWDVLKSRYKNLKLILAGPLEDRDGIHSHLISKILNDNRIVFLGQIKETNVYYKLMNLFLLPSYREGFPTVILEASSMGLPVVTSRKTGCIDSIIENVTGKYCEISPNSIVQVLDEYIQNSDLCIQHGLNGRKFVRENFEQEVIWNSLLKLYSGEN